MEDFTKEIQIGEIPSKGVRCSMIASDQILGAIALQIDVQAVMKLDAKFHVTKFGKYVTVEGQLSAEVEQRCIISLEPIISQFDEPFSITFTQEEEKIELNEYGEAVVDLSQPEPLIEAFIDLGNIAIEQLALVIDPYPRKQGAEPLRDKSEQPDISPFAALKAMKPPQ